MTVTRMATPRGPILVTVDTLEASGGPGGGRIPWAGGWEGGAQTHINPKPLDESPKLGYLKPEDLAVQGIGGAQEPVARGKVGGLEFRVCCELPCRQ